jgi:hypothetical protein
MAIGMSNVRLMHCRPTALVLEDFLVFLDG